jgi:hypothetical protein
VEGIPIQKGEQNRTTNPIQFLFSEPMANLNRMLNRNGHPAEPLTQHGNLPLTVKCPIFWMPQTS